MCIQDDVVWIIEFQCCLQLVVLVVMVCPVHCPKIVVMDYPQILHTRQI